MAILDTELAAQLKGYLERLQESIVFETYFDSSEKSEEMFVFLKEIAALTDKISMEQGRAHERIPSFGIRKKGDDKARIFFAGIPLGHEFTSLVLAILQVGGHPVKLDPETVESIQGLEGDLYFETYISLSCHNCPDVVQNLNMMALLNPNITHTMVDGALFQKEIEERNIMAVPSVYLNGKFFETGRIGLEEILGRLDDSTVEKAAERISGQDPFEVLVIGGGPAGCTAAIYSARKGLRTGLVAERFGGQLLDTSSIENFISIPEIEGPKLALALEAHVRIHDISIMASQKIKSLTPAPEKGGLHEISLENGASLKAKTVIIASGAHWREMNVPGENAYRTRGVTFCPHCDGPLFKEKRVAVVGGGNSGVEAAIDLAGIADHVTLLELAPTLKADDILQKKLESLPNVSIETGIQVKEVLGDGERVTGLSCENCADGSKKELPLDGVFVQIGLLPNSDFTGDSLKKDAFNQIIVDAGCKTSVDGIFAAGDVTNTPYKQIVIALGEGAKAALSAFDYLIRN